MNDTVDISKKQTKVRKRKKCRKAVENKKIVRPAKTTYILINRIFLVLNSCKILWKRVNDLR